MLTAAAAAMCVASCTTSVAVDAQFPTPLVERLPVRVGVIFDEELQQFEHYEEIPRASKFTIQLGKANIAMFTPLFETMFLESHTVTDVALARAVTLTRSDVADFPAPPSHDDPRWPAREGHGAVTRRSMTTNCATCHAQQFCYQCHAGGTPPRLIAALASDPRSTALVALRAPVSHGANFADRHAAPAAAGTASCSSCHIRSDCLECHRTTAANAPGYHPAGFVSRHPAAAYARETSPKRPGSRPSTSAGVKLKRWPMPRSSVTRVCSWTKSTRSRPSRTTSRRVCRSPRS